MPSNHFIVASRGPNPELYIFDLTKHPSFPDKKQSVHTPQGVCVGHTKEGYALEWSRKRPGILLSASDDCTCKLWDISAVSSAKVASAEAGTMIEPLATFNGHTKTVEDVDWHAKDDNLFGSVGDDRIIQIWDSRTPSALHTVKAAHEGDINSIAFNPVQEFLFATGSADKTIKLWDMRNLGRYVVIGIYQIHNLSYLE
jgi:histone-binding protein RBBP4